MSKAHACSYCGTYNPFGEFNCRGCGAPLDPNIEPELPQETVEPTVLEEYYEYDEFKDPDFGKFGFSEILTMGIFAAFFLWLLWTPMMFALDILIVMVKLLFIVIFN